jgi:hypothetical protein
MLVLCVLVVPALQAQNVKASALPKLSADLEATRNQLDRFKDPIVAVREGYLSTHVCTGYADGGMGVHFINMATVGPNVDPKVPQVLIYEHDGESLRLVAAEWFVPVAAVTEKPSVFGKPFDGPMDGHEPLMPRELHHYDLHVWLWKENPSGVFNSVNPDLECPAGSPYSVVSKEKSTAHLHKH